MSVVKETQFDTTESKDTPAVEEPVSEPLLGEEPSTKIHFPLFQHPKQVTILNQRHWETLSTQLSDFDLSVMELVPKLMKHVQTLENLGPQKRNCH